MLSFVNLDLNLFNLINFYFVDVYNFYSSILIKFISFITLYYYASYYAIAFLLISS